MLWAAKAILAVASTIAGGLPAPAPTAFLPLISAWWTTAGPPVIDSMATSGCCITSCTDSIEGVSSETTKLCNPVASATNSFNFSIVQRVMFLAPGWAPKNNVFPPANIMMALAITVSEGLVLGPTAPMTPNGAYSYITSPPSPVSASGCRISGPGVL